MSNNCLNKNSVEFQTNLKKSGLSELDFAVEVDSYFDLQRSMGVSEEDLKYPELDRIDNANSSQYLIEHIKLKNGSAKIQDILNYALNTSIEESTISINDKHRDLEVTITPLNETALVSIERRPTKVEDKARPKVLLVKDKQALIPIFYKLASLYGIKFHNVTTDDLLLDSKFKDVLDAKHTNAFILNGDIYINTDIADIDAPLHELSHLLLGGIKFQNPSLYLDLISISEKLPDYEELSLLYFGRTRSDILEEVFVTEFAKFLSDKTSSIQNLPEYILEELLYNARRLLDSIFMGDVSVTTVSALELSHMSLFDIAELVNSDIFELQSNSVLNDGHIHRILNNRKSDLINKGDLKEHCV